MNLRLLLLVFCLAGNVLLAMALLRHGSHASTAPGSTPADNLPFKTHAPTATAAGTEASSASADTDTNAPPFTWLKFTTADFAVYIKQLRAFGTPEKQVREIIMGAIDAMYRPRRAALMPPPKKRDEAKFWVRRNFYGSQSTMTADERTQMRALRKEETDLVKSLFGADIYEQIAKDAGDAGGVDWTEKQYGYLPKELREKVQEVEERMNDESQQIYADAQDNNDWQYQQTALRKLDKKYHDELAKILTPEQLQDWDMRHSQTANDLKNNLSAFGPNEDEFRALFKYQQAMETINPPYDPDADPVQLTADQRKANSDAKKALDAELADAVGTNRVAEYKLEQDYSYRGLIDAGLPKESAFKLDDIKKQAQDAANKIRRDKTLTPDQRTDALSNIGSETRNSINDLLGDKFSKRYMSQGGYWLNNIAPKPQPAPVQ